MQSPRLLRALALALITHLGLLPPASTAAATAPATPLARPDLIQAVEQGRQPVARADWWGADPSDATSSIQAALKSPAHTVVIPYTGHPWIVRPLDLRNNLELILEPGVVLLAKSGEFRGRGDSLLRAANLTNVTIRGYGATLRMRKAEYQKPPYEPAEWRMGISIVGSSNVRIEGLRIESSGGDGIYIGSTAENRWCRNVEIRDCVCTDHHRQGMSVISAENLLVERCTFAGTEGTAPEAGIDFEPDTPDERLVHCLVRQCRFENNAGNAMLVYLKPLRATSAPVSIRFESCIARPASPVTTRTELTPADRRGWSGMAVGWVGNDGPKGLVEFVDCVTEWTGREGLRIVDKSESGVLFRFTRCHWAWPWVAAHERFTGPRAALLFHQQDPAFCARPGGLEFIDCSISEDRDGPVARYEGPWSETGDRMERVTGRLQVQSRTPTKWAGGKIPLGLEFSERLDTKPVPK